MSSDQSSTINHFHKETQKLCSFMHLADARIHSAFRLYIFVSVWYDMNWKLTKRLNPGFVDNTTWDMYKQFLKGWSFVTGNNGLKYVQQHKS